MIFDSTNLFSDAQAITVTAVSTNVIDFGATDTPKYAANAITRDMGKGRPIEVVAQVVTAFTGETAQDDENLTVSVQTATDEAFSSPVTIWTAPAAADGATLVAGYRIPIYFLPQNVLRYVRLNYAVAGTADFTAGAITAGFVFAAEERDV